MYQPSANRILAEQKGVTAMRWIQLVFIAALLLCMAGSVGAVCGDVTGDGDVDISDIAYLFSYLAGDAPEPPNPADANVDGRAGITFSDAVMIIHSIFGPYDIPYPPNTCGLGLTYTFGASIDSVFFPHMPLVPDGVDTVLMPVVTYLDTNSRGVYLPFLVSNAVTDKFKFDRIISNVGNQIIGGPWINYSGLDTVCLSWAVTDWPGWPTGVAAGRKSLTSIRYIRTSPGVGSITPVMVQRSSLWKPSVIKNEDLFIPFTGYYNFAFPPETLKVVTSAMAFDAVAGYASTDSFTVSFTSSGLPITFELAADDPWITIVDTGAVGFKTPCTVVVRATAVATGIGDYATQIHFTNLSPTAPTTIAAIDATMHVRAPNLYPFGDLDCDGIVDISDLTKIIDRLYISLSPLVPCQP